MGCDLRWIISFFTDVYLRITTPLYFQIKKSEFQIKKSHIQIKKDHIQIKKGYIQFEKKSHSI